MFELALPWVLLGLPVPVLLWFLLPQASLHVTSALKVPFYNDIARVIVHETHAFSTFKKAGLCFLIWALILIALAGPRWVGPPIPLAREGYNLMLALDLSGSMELPDMRLHGRPVSRLTIVKRAAEAFVQARTGDKIGLILFGSRAYLQTPLTYDHQNVLMRLEDATVGLAGKTTSIGDALGLAVKRLKTAPKQGRVIILLTDGVNNSGILPPLKAAELARADDIKVYTIGLGTEPDPRALNHVFLNINTAAELDEATLQQVAKMTGGRYFRATDLNSLQSIYDTINTLEKTTQEKASIRPQQEYYPWPLALAYLLFLYWLCLDTGLLATMRRAGRKESST